MSQRPRASLKLNLRCDEHAPAAVRQAMRSLVAVGPSLPDAMLVASELVTNAVCHAEHSERDAIDVSVQRFDQHLHISVRDPIRAHRDRSPPTVECAAECLGLRILGQLTSRWGSQRQAGYVLWAEVPLMACVSA